MNKNKKTTASSVVYAKTNSFKWHFLLIKITNTQGLIFAVPCSIWVKILLHCMLMSVFLCQTPQMPPSPLVQETGLWVWRKLSWTARAADTPNLRTSPGHGTVISLSAAHTYLQFNSVWLQESDNHTLIRPTAVLSELLNCTLHGTGMCPKTYISRCEHAYTRTTHPWTTKKCASI